MASVERVSARLVEFMTSQKIANTSFSPDRERLDFYNTEMHNRVSALEVGVAAIVERRMEVTELRKRIVATETMSADRSSD